MSDIDAVIRRQMLAGAKAVAVLSVLLPRGLLPPVAIDDAREIIGDWHGVPYSQFCRHPEMCAGKGSCPRDPICCD